MESRLERGSYTHEFLVQTYAKGEIAEQRQKVDQKSKLVVGVESTYFTVKV